MKRVFPARDVGQHHSVEGQVAQLAPWVLTSTGPGGTRPPGGPSGFAPAPCESLAIFLARHLCHPSSALTQNGFTRMCPADGRRAIVRASSPVLDSNILDVFATSGRDAPVHLELTTTA
jgi:hypothetical protein